MRYHRVNLSIQILKKCLIQIVLLTHVIKTFLNRAKFCEKNKAKYNAKDLGSSDFKASSDFKV